jgi:hypothetical protein
MLEGLVDGAYGLAVRYSAAAKAEPDNARSLEFLDGFLKCGFAVRMGIRLCVSLRAPPRAAPERAERADAGRTEREPSERLDRDRPEREREREREYEPVSLPKFLATLGVVARDAERLGDRLPGAAGVLPALKGLLAEANADPPSMAPGPAPASEVAVRARTPQIGSRDRLLRSAAAPARSTPRARPPWPNSG